MKKKVNPLFLAAVLLIPLFSAGAFAADEEQPKALRIRELIPEAWIKFPYINPSIPSDYVMKPSENGMSAMWGAKEDVEKYKLGVNGQEPPSRAIFVLQYSSEQQTGSSSFSFTKHDIIQRFGTVGFNLSRARSSQWGKYPLFVYEGSRSSGEIARSLWIGLNSPNEEVLHVSMISTKNKMQDDKLWNRFIDNTSQLEGADYFLASGSDMKEGCTIYSCAMASVKATAEKRLKDKKLEVNVTPLTEGTSFEIQKISQSTMTGDWMRGEPITKIAGVLTYEKDSSRYILNTTINVFTKDVANFSTQKAL